MLISTWRISGRKREVSWDSSYDLSREELYDAFADFGGDRIVDIYYEDGERDGLLGVGVDIVQAISPVCS